MSSVGIVREYHPDDGWGVIDGEQVPGGCWVSFAVIRMDGYRNLVAGQQVRFVEERANQDGFSYRATAVWPDPGPTKASEPFAPEPSEGYSSILDIKTDTN
jgi:cold shock protein